MPDTVVYVDLDDTLVRTDTLWESFVLLLKQKPWLASLLPFWLFRGKAALKRRFAEHIHLSPSDLAYHDDVLEFLRDRKIAGAEIVLATAADTRVARIVADHIGLFSSVLASDGTTNLVGHKKLEAIRRHAAGRAFEYIGDSAVDIPIWQSADLAHIVQRGATVVRTLPPGIRIGRIFDHESPNLQTILRLLRIKQWIKNFLLFAPLLLAHQLTEQRLIWVALAAFFSFSFCASGVYVFNDLLDLDTDRRHPEKRERPLTNGMISIPLGMVLASICLLFSFAIATLFLPQTFLFILGGYLVLNGLYSFVFKRLLILDVIVLALMYAYRIFAGSVATDIPITHWLLAFAAFFFLSLAILKRFSELQLLKRETSDHVTRGRGYRVQDADTLRMLGLNSGFLAVLILTLYLNSQDVTGLYPRPMLLWGVVFALVYWIARLWILAERGSIHDDPLLFTTNDRASYAIGFVVLFILAAASLPLL